MQSVGVPCTANCLGPRRSKRSGWFRVRACPWPLCSRSGATTQTVPSWPRISSRTLSPSAPKPSSLVIRIGPALIEPPSGPAIMQCPVTDGSGLVGATGFEPATPCTPSRCATRLRYAPKPLRSSYFLSLLITKTSASTRSGNSRGRSWRVESRHCRPEMPRRKADVVPHAHSLRVTHDRGDGRHADARLGQPAPEGMSQEVQVRPLRLGKLGPFQRTLDLTRHNVPAQGPPLAVTQHIIRPNVSCNIIQNSGQAHVEGDGTRLACLALVDENRPARAIHLRPPERQALGQPHPRLKE